MKVMNERESLEAPTGPCLVWSVVKTWIWHRRRRISMVMRWVSDDTTRPALTQEMRQDLRCVLVFGRLDRFGLP
jgi:hypothetical protein